MRRHGQGKAVLARVLDVVVVLLWLYVLISDVNAHDWVALGCDLTIVGLMAAMTWARNRFCHARVLLDEERERVAALRHRAEALLRS